MTTLPRTMISPSVSPSCGTSRPSLAYDPQLARADQLDALARLDPGALRGRQVAVLGARLAEGDERRRLGEAVDLRQFPAEFAFDQLDGGGSRRGTGREEADAARNPSPEFRRRVGDAYQHRRRSAEHGDALVADQLEDQFRLDPAQADIGHAAGGIDP